MVTVSTAALRRTRFLRRLMGDGAAAGGGSHVLRADALGREKRYGI